MRIWQGICLSAVLFGTIATVGHAQTSASPEDEYKKLIRINEDIQPLGENPFGENISLYSGALSFEQTDISLAGNGPTLSISRTFTFNTQPELFQKLQDTAFGDWDINLPRITTVAAIQNNVQGWMVTNGNPYALCTRFGPPPSVNPPDGDSARNPWDASDWWSGYQLVVPGVGSQDLLLRSAQNTLAPQISGMNFPIVTKHNWAIGCLPHAANDANREAFLAISPDGTQYTLDHLAYRWMPKLDRSLHTLSGPDAAGFAIGPKPMLQISDSLAREQAAMLVTQIKDRFGNTLIFSYDASNRLTGIVASDGRSVSVSYNGAVSRISSITLQPSNAAPRTWSYQYAVAGSNPTLTQVTLPDLSSWHYDLANLAYAAWIDTRASVDPQACSALITPTNLGAVFTGSITHPSGLTGTFTVKPLKRGRSYVNQSCWSGAPDVPTTQGFAVIPDAWYAMALTSKQFVGAGLATTQTWNYSYSPANQSWAQDCATDTSCPKTVTTDVTDPDGDATRYTFSNYYDVSESQLLQTDFYNGGVSGAALRSEANTYEYVHTATDLYPTQIGANPQPRINAAQTEQLFPLNKRVINQDGGDTYTWQGEGFDAFGAVTKTKRFSSTFSQCLPTSTQCIEEQTSFLNDTSLWVLGLPLQVTNVAKGDIESANTYDTSNDTLLTRAHFGQTLMHYTFNAQGQLASFTDGNNHTTGLSNYKRGIPQAISYSDSTSETLTVDDFGQISSIKDQAGHTTSYGYDGVGRITGITYPSGDEVAWLPKTFTYSFVTGAERGVPANHWRRTIANGNARAVTYFDALLRPVLSDSYINGVSGSNTTTLANYDAKGQKTFASYPDATPLNFTMTPATAGIQGGTTTHDALGRTTQVQQDSELGTLTSTTVYLSGARQQVTDPKTKVTTTSYQVFDQPSYDKVIKVQAPAGITQTIARDVYGNPQSITQSGLYGATETDTIIKKLIYDSYYRLCRTSEPESGSEVMGYDGANNLAWSVSGATLNDDGSCHPELAQSTSVTTRTYDAMNRLLTILPPAFTQSTQYHYTLLGQPDRVVSGISTWSGAYNYRGMLTGESLQVDGPNALGIGYAHDAYGSLSLIHYPDGENVSYAPDALGRPIQVGSYASGIGYFPNGQVSEFIYGNGTAYAADQNGRQLLSNFSYGTGAAAQLSEDVSYDANGNITHVTDLASGPRTKAFTYDDLNRLSTATAAGLWGSEAYTYDALNNLRTLQTGSQVSTYHYDPSNKLASITSGATTLDSFQYDNRGNVINKSGANLVFDQKNQLTQIQGYDDYAYDAAGRRVKKTPTGGTPTYYFYNQAGQLLYQLDAATLKSTNFIYLGSKLIARDVGASIPTLTTPAISGTGNYTVSWTGLGGVASYTLQEQVNGGSWSTIQSSNATSTAITAKADGSYGYRAQACNSLTCTPWSGTATTTVVHPPITPASITVPATSSGSVAVSWVASSAATSYTLQQLGSSGWSTVYTGAATSSTRSVTTSGSYTYQVAACNAGGCSAYRVSSAVVVTIPPTSAPTLTVPATSSTGSYTVSWSAVTAATSYTLQEQVNGGSWATIQATSAISKALSGKVDGTYGYKVQACNAGGCATWSSTQSVTVTHPPTAAPSLSVPASNISGSYTVSWGTVPLATSYTLQQQTGGGAWTTLQTSSALSKALNGQYSGTYAYQVRGCNAGGCGPWSSTQNITVLLIPGAPGWPSLTVKAGTIVTATWSSVNDAASYTVEDTPTGGPAATFYTGPNTTASGSLFVNGQVAFHVKACNASGCSPWSANSYATLQGDVLIAQPAESGTVQGGTP